MYIHPDISVLSTQERVLLIMF